MHTWNVLTRILNDRKEPIADAEIMHLLGFSPPSWKTWKSKLIEMTNITIITQFEKSDDNGVFKPVEIEPHRVKYDKKTKKWHWVKA